MTSVVCAQSFNLPERNGTAGSHNLDLDPKYPEYNGKIIREIQIEVRDIFPDAQAGGVYSMINSLKVSTRDETIRQELLFKVGHQYNDFKRLESVRALRGLRFLRNVSITPKADGNYVDVLISVTDTWTLIPQINYSTGDGRQNMSAGVADSNVGGYGKRAEMLYRDEDGERGVQAVWDDPRVLGTPYRLVLGQLERVDGHRTVAVFGRPFRNLLQKESWLSEIDDSNTVGALFQDGTESYIWRQKIQDYNVRYAISKGNPESGLYRYSFGLDYYNARFLQATLSDYNDLDLNPDQVSNDPADLPKNRRYVGPVFGFEKIHPDYISMNYIDRFDREETYDLGSEYSFNIWTALDALGSLNNAVILSGNHNKGYRIGRNSFLRTEIGGATRYSNEEFANTLLRAEAKMYSVLGNLYVGDLFLGRHTLALNGFIDYGIDIDNDRQFLVGGDNVIRGYKANAFGGSKRIGFNFEDRAVFAEDVLKLISVGGAVFFDLGAASYDSMNTMLGNQVYSDVGFGLRFAFPRSSGGRVLRLDVAFPLRDGPDGSLEWEPRVLISGGQLFGSQLRSESLGVEKANVEVGFDR